MSSERLLLVPLIALAAGSILEYLLAVPVSVLVPVVAAVGLVSVVPLKNRQLFGCLLAFFWASWGMATLSQRLVGGFTDTGIARFNGQQVVIEGLLLRRPITLPEGQRFELQVERIYRNNELFLAKTTVLVTIDQGEGSWLPGDRIRFSSKLKVPRLLGLPGEFDYPRYLALRGIAATAWVKDAESVVLMRGAAKPSLFRWIDQLAVHSHQFVKQTLSDPDQRGVVLALATGAQQEVSACITAAYSRAGVSHILSVSGFHVGVVTLVWISLLRWLLLRWEWLALRIDLRRAVMLSALPLMLFYLIFTGGAPATARSVLMLAALVLAVWSEREVDILDVLLLAAFLLLLTDPALLFDLSFQLSFLALWGLVVLTPSLMSPFERFIKHGWQHSLLLFCSASLATVLATLLPVLAAFHQASFTGILANLVVVPLLGYGATVLSTVAIPLIFMLPDVAAVLLQLAGWLVQLSNLFVVWIAGLPILHSFCVGPFDLLVLAVLLVLFSFVRSIRFRVLISLVLLAVLTVQHFSSVQADDGKLRLMFLSVGQGDALLIKLPDGRTLLVDGGGYLFESSRDFGERYLVPALHSLKVSRIDFMVLTHPHPDHLGGLPAVAEQFQIGEFWQTAALGEGHDYQRLITALHRQQTRLRVLKQGDCPLLAGTLVCTVLSPLEQNRSGPVENDASLVLHLQHDSFSALFMGDAGFAVEDQLAKYGLGEITVLKVGHHGSKSASGEHFLGKIRPKVAVVSAGAGNSFGLPAPETLERIRQQGARVYRTDLQGSVMVTNDKSGYMVTPLVTENRLVAATRRFILTGSEWCVKKIRW